MAMQCACGAWASSCLCENCRRKIKEREDEKRLQALEREHGIYRNMFGHQISRSEWQYLNNKDRR